MTMALVPAHEVEKARAVLREAVDELSTAKVIEIEHDDGSRSHAVAPSLLAQLANDINGIEPGGSFTARSRPPLRLDAMQLLREIDVTTCCRVTAERSLDVHTWGQRCASALTGADLIDASDTARRWLDSVREMLDPAPKRRARGVPCPRCGAAKVWAREDTDNDEAYSRPALMVDETRGACVCEACGASWGIEFWAHLAAVLEQQAREEEEQMRDLTATPPATRTMPDAPVQCSRRVPDASDETGQRTRRCPRLLDVFEHCPIHGAPVHPDDPA